MAGKGHGGRRANSGRPKGYKLQKTIDKEAAREVSRALITASLRPMIQAHIAHACGIGHVYTRDKAGKFSKVENQAQIDKLLTEGIEGEAYWLFSKDPSPQSFKELLDRALDKAKEQEQTIKVSGELTLLDRIAKARARITSAS